MKTKGDTANRPVQKRDVSEVAPLPKKRKGKKRRLLQKYDGSVSLWNAAANGDVDGVKQALAEGADPQAGHGAYGHTALTIAALNGHLDVVKSLLGANVPVDETGSSEGITPLLGASFEGHIDIVRALISSGANVDTPGDVTGATPLFAASQEGHLEVVQALVEAGADVDKWRTSDGATPLFAASAQDHPEVVRVLVNAGANGDKKRKHIGDTPLSFASQEGHLDVVKILVAAKPGDRHMRQTRNSPKKVATRSQAIEEPPATEPRGSKDIDSQPVSNLNGLKDGQGDGPQPPPLDPDTNEYEVEQLLDTRLRRLPNGLILREYKVSWKGYGQMDITWEPEHNLTIGADELLQEFWRHRDQKRSDKPV